MTKTIKEVMDQINDYMEISTNLSLTTRKKYEKIIKLFLLGNGLSFNVNDINIFLTNKNKKSNCYNYKYAFKYFLSSIGKDNLYERVKSVKKKPRKKVFKHIDKSDLQKMLNMLPLKYRILALLQYKCGCRFIESATIRIENIDFKIKDDLIYITLGGGYSKVKGNKGRKVRLSTKYSFLLKNIIIKPYGFLFLRREFESYDEDTFLTKMDSIKRTYNKRLNEVGERFGYEGFSSHYLRHLFADEFMLAGGTIESLKTVLGHAQLDTTLSYISIGDRFADEIIKKMS